LYTCDCSFQNFVVHKILHARMFERIKKILKTILRFTELISQFARRFSPRILTMSEAQVRRCTIEEHVLQYFGRAHVLLNVFLLNFNGFKIRCYYFHHWFKKNTRNEFLRFFNSAFQKNCQYSEVNDTDVRCGGGREGGCQEVRPGASFSTLDSENTIPAAIMNFQTTITPRVPRRTPWRIRRNHLTGMSCDEADEAPHVASVLEEERGVEGTNSGIHRSMRARAARRAAGRPSSRALRFARGNRACERQRETPRFSSSSSRDGNSAPETASFF